ncbi:hypothetical protein C7447_1086 [Tenacibaculum adriaticum]|uniref:Lipocalin-like protein n=1 Tax=Tenacibaculum adriaticum TaxID=413713 RepID=A0A5S5DMI9_9FLAO|nr:hypothetical protein [Tenacibaculum adriaticum]TYP96256.1 hypothetical protein C7447_1086 [Tenacibaculum adriaticum]
MRQFKKLFFLPLMVFALLTSCQKEEVNIVNPTEESIIKNNSTTATLMSRTATNDGSVDNIIDNANCLEIILPVTVTANGITVTIESITDYSVLEGILDEFTNDNDEVAITFPIHVTLNNYTEIVLNSQEELNQAIEGCVGENEEDDDIECIDFKYPISFSIYNTSFQIIETKTINNDSELYHFMESLDGAILASLNFPVSLINPSGEIIEVASNQELDEALSNADEACDEDDDYDYNDDDSDCTETYVDELLMKCHWVAVSYNGDNQLTDYDVYFKENQQLLVTGNGVQFEGVWSTSQSTANTVSVEISQLGGGTHEDLNGQWSVTDCSEYGRFVFVKDSVEMVMEKECQTSPDCTEEEVKNYLNYCVWNVVDFNGSNDLLEYDLSFDLDGTFSVTGNGQSTTANWSISMSATNDVEVELSNIAGANIQAINGTWKVYQCAENRMKFINNNGGYFIVERQNCYTEEELFNAALECQWKVNSLIVDGVDFTDNNPFLFTFYENEFAIASNGDVISYGSLTAESTSNDQLVVLLSIFNNSTLGDYYVVKSITNEVIIFESGNKELKLVRNCDNSTPDEDVVQIKEWMTDGNWSITYALEDSVDITADYYSIDFDFQSNTDLVGFNNNDQISSTLHWNVVRDQSGKLRFVIDYLGTFPYWQMDDDWYITEVTSTRIELHYVNDSTNNEFVLVFEKQ